MLHRSVCDTVSMDFTFAREQLGLLRELRPAYGTKLPIWNVRFHGEYRG
jgi:hypothetical protein